MCAFHNTTSPQLLLEPSCRANMGGRKIKKRKHAQLAQDTADGDNNTGNIGIGTTLAHLLGDQPPAGPDGGEPKSDSEEWTTVGRGGKKQKRLTTQAWGTASYTGCSQASISTSSSDLCCTVWQMELLRNGYL